MSFVSFQRPLRSALQLAVESTFEAPESKPTKHDAAHPLDIGYIVHNRKLNSRMQLDGHCLLSSCCSE